MSRWKLVVTATLGFLGAVSAGYRVLQGEGGILRVVVFLAFLGIFAMSVWPVLSGNSG